MLPRQKGPGFKKKFSKDNLTAKTNAVDPDYIVTGVAILFTSSKSPGYASAVLGTFIRYRRCSRSRSYCYRCHHKIIPRQIRPGNKKYTFKEKCNVNANADDQYHIHRHAVMKFYLKK